MNLGMDYIRHMPLRKCLAILITFVWVIVVIAKIKEDRDIPPNVFNLLLAMCGAVYGGYFGTSSVEHCKKLSVKPLDNEEDIDHEPVQ